MENKVSKKLKKLVTEYGEQKIQERLRHIELELRESAQQDVLTIICSAGLHAIPQKYMRGDVFTVMKGALNMETSRALRVQLSRHLKYLADKLTSHPWKRIYLIPTGHSALTMQVKLLVFRITRIETVDVVYLGHGRYLDLSIDQRALVHRER